MTTNYAPPETIIADATTSAGGLGKIANVAATSGTLMVRCPNVGFGRTKEIDWRVKSSQAYTAQLYRSRNFNDYAVTLTLLNFTDTNTIVINGLTYTGEATAADAAWASRKFSTAGTDTQDAAQLAALINADNTITPNGSVSVGDTITVVTTDDAGGTNTYVYTAAATPNYLTRVFDQSGNQAAELASIVLALNHRRNVTCLNVLAGDTVTITGKHDVKYTYTAHADTTSGTNFAINGDAAAEAGELVTAINTQSATHGYTATAVSTAVHISRNSADVPEPIITSSNGTRLACVNTAGGVPGVAAVATGATGELGITPTYAKTVTVTTSNGTRLATVDIDIPGVVATSADAVVTIKAGTPGNPTGGDQAYVLQATAAANCTVAEVLTSLVTDGAVTASRAANSTTAGYFENQSVKGWDHAYLKFLNGAGSAATVTIAATKY